MAPRRRPSRPVVWLLSLPTVITAGAFAAAADNALAAGIVGALVGFFIGIALVSFPNLDRGGPGDNDDMFIH